MMFRTSTWVLLSVSVALLCVLPWSTLFILLSMCVLSHVVWNHVMHQPDKSCDLPLPPGGLGLPLLGETHTYLMSAGENANWQTEKYGKIFKTHIFGNPLIRISGYENINKIFANKDDVFMNYYPDSTRKLLGTDSGATMTNGEVHKQYRKLYTRVFTSQSLQRHLPNISSIIKDTLKEWISVGDLVVYTRAHQLAFTVAYRCLMGLPPDDALIQVMDAEYETFRQGLFTIPLNIPGTKFYKAMQAKQQLLDNARPYLVQDRSKLDPDSAIYHMIDYSKEIGMTLTDKNVLDLALEMAFAGHVTNSSLLTAVCLAVGKHAEVKEQLEEELKQHGMLGQEEPVIDYNTLIKMPYLENFMKEVLLHYPPAGGGFRRATQTVQLQGYQIPKDWLVVFSIRGTHSLVLAENPGFNPSRWEKSNQSGFLNRSLMPFGGGNTLCSGKDFAMLVMKLFTVHLLRMCDLHLKNPDVKMVAMPSNHPADGLPVTMLAKQW